MNKMKWIVLCATALFAASCSDRLEDEIANIAGKPVTLRATIESDGTRAAIDNGKMIWQAGDEISVRLNDGSNLKMKVATGDVGKGEATFTGLIVGEGKSIPASTVAIYPYNATHTLADGSLAVNMPDTYDVSEGDNTNTNMPMVCELTDGAGTFKHVGGVMQFKIGLEYILAASKEPTQIRLTIKDGQNITGSFPVAGGVITATKGDGTASSVTIKFNADQIVDKAVTVNVPLPVGTYKGLDLDILDAEGNKLVETFGTDATNTVSRTKRIKMPKLTPVELVAGTDPGEPLPANAIAVDNTPTSFNANND